MYDSPVEPGEERLAPVSYLPWATPGVTGDSADESVRDHGDERARDRDRAGARDRGGDRARPATPRPGRSSNRRDAARVSAMADAGAAEPETGVERDERIDRMVLGRLRRSSLSVAEVRRVLSEHGLDEVEVEEWIERYSRLGYLDDARLAEQLVHTGAERRGRGSGAILSELGRRGVDPETARAALGELDPELERGNALAVAERRARQLRGLDRSVAERRLSAFLQRRGYSGEVIRDAVATALTSESS